MSLPRFAIRRPITVFMIGTVAVLIGAMSFLELPVDLMPDIEYPVITVFTSYPSVAPEEMETLITRPIEQSVGSAPGVEAVIMARTPGIVSARLVSTRWTRACACGQRTIAACSMSGRVRSSVYTAVPLTRS